MKKHRLSKKFTLELRDKVDISLETLIELIKTPHLKRTKNDSKLIQNYLCQNIDYFKKLTQEPDGNEKIPKIISVLNYESFKKDEHIIYFGEIGDKFYILLSGTVSIYKPSPKNMNMTLHDYVDYLVRIRDYEKNLLKFERVIKITIFKQKNTSSYRRRKIFNKIRSRYIIWGNGFNKK